MSETPNFGGQNARQKSRRTRGASMIAILAGVPMLFAPASALAQAAAESEVVDDAASEIVVTGTRISGFSAPTPVTTFGEEQLEDKAVATVSELLDDVPQLRINQNIGKSSEPVGFSTADLRGLTPQRTLVMIDSRRVGITDPQGTIDTNIVPVALISSIEVVTGGASAAYGSDAVAGVVNFRLNHDLEGFRGDVSYGETRYGDFRRPAANFAWGNGFMNDRLRLTIAGDYMENSGQTRQASRDWGDDLTALITNPAYTPTNGQPRLLISNNSRFVDMTQGGVIGAGTNRTASLNLAQALGFPAGTGVQFDASGNAVPFRYGTNIGGVFMTGGDGGSMQDDGNIQPAIERMSAYGRVSYEFAPNLTFFADAIYSRLNVISDLAANYNAGTTALTIRNDNAFLPTNVRNAMAALSTPITSFAMGREIAEDGDSVFDNQTDVLRLTFGLEGEVAGWDWDVSAQIGRNEYQSDSHNNRINVRFTNAVDSVINPSTGLPVCRVTLANPAANDTTDPYRDIRDCVALDPFGAGSITANAQGYYLGTSSYQSEQSQDVYAANISGSPFSTWAGAVSLAFGGEYRREETVQTADSDSALRRWRSINTQPFSGEYDVTEGYAEVVVPLASNAPLAQNLEFNGAVRYTDYSTSGGVTTWKAGFNYEPVDDIRFRATVSRDIRAPNNFELFSNGNQVINAVTDPRDNLQRQTLQVTTGNPNLTPEEADTTTFGVIWSPSFFPGFRASVDYYDIEITQAISTVTAQNIADSCWQGQTQFCANVIRDPSTQVITRINIAPFNADSLRTSGIDLEALYRTEVATGGDVTLRFLANYVDELATTANGRTTDYVGLAGISAPPAGVPSWRYNFEVGYDQGPFNMGVTYRYIGGGQFDTRFNTTVLDLADNNIEGIGYIDVNAAYDVNETLTVYGRVENLLDEDPPIAPNAIVQPTVANSSFFDRRGLFFVIGGRVRFD